MKFVNYSVLRSNNAKKCIRKHYVLICAFLLTIFIACLTLHIIVHYVWQNRPPMRMVYKVDVVRYANATWTRRRIPRVIHQVWRTHNVPPRWNATFHSVLAKNIGQFEHHLWTDEEMHQFVHEHEPKFYENTYITYPYDIQRVDSFRYVLLYHKGGIYMDLDVGCNRSLNDLLNTLEALDPDSADLAALPADKFSIGIESDFLISTAGHPFFKQLISRLHLFNHYFILHFWTVLVSTGPIYVGLQERLFSSSAYKDTLRILDCEIVQPMFLWKVVGQEWVGKDASVLFFINANAEKFFWYGKIFIICFVVFFYIKCCRPKS